MLFISIITPPSETSQGKMNDVHRANPFQVIPRSFWEQTAPDPSPQLLQTHSDASEPGRPESQDPRLSSQNRGSVTVW